MMTLINRNFLNFFHKNLKTMLPLILLMVAIFAGLGLIVPYMSLWLDYKELNVEAIGYVIGAFTIMRIIGALIITRFGEGIAGARRIICWLGLALTFSWILLSLQIPIWLLILFLLASGFCYGPLVPLTDVITLKLLDVNSHFYGQIRLWGSFAFLVFNVVGGIYLSEIGYIYFPIAVVFCTFIVILAAYFLPKGLPLQVSTSSDIQVNRWRAPYFYPVLIIVLIQSSHGMFYVIGSLYWDGLGFSQTQIGLLWASGVLAEIIAFALFSGRTQNIPVIHLFLIAAALGSLRWILMTQDYEIFWYHLGVQTLHAASFGLTHLAAIQWLGQFQNGLAKEAGTISTAIIVASAAVSAIAGVLFEQFAQYCFLASALLCLFAFLLSLFARRLNLQPQSSDVVG